MTDVLGVRCRGIVGISKVAIQECQVRTRKKRAESGKKAAISVVRLALQSL